jgi:hypothetical protein
MDCFAHAIPFVELVRALGDLPTPGHTPVFDALCVAEICPPMPYPRMSFKLRMRSTGTVCFHPLRNHREWRSVGGGLVISTEVVSE